MIRIFDNAVNVLWMSRWKYISLDQLLTLYFYHSLIFFVIWNIVSNNILKKSEKFHVIYYFIFVRNKSESFLVLYPKFDMNA